MTKIKNILKKTNVNVLALLQVISIHVLCTSYAISRVTNQSLFSQMSLPIYTYMIYTRYMGLKK